MKKKNIFILMILLGIFFNKIDALNNVLKKKYPYTVLTEDYGILNEEDLDSKQDGIKSPPFLPKEGYGYIYWQCFSRDKISINLKDMGYSSEDIGWDENYSDLKIAAIDQSGVYHEYTMRKLWPTSGYEERFNTWIKLMKNEKYVCIAGDFINHEDRIVHGEKEQIYSWVFDKMKTKKGCDYYFKR